MATIFGSAVLKLLGSRACRRTAAAWKWPTEGGQLWALTGVKWRGSLLKKIFDPPRRRRGQRASVFLMCHKINSLSICRKHRQEEHSAHEITRNRCVFSVRYCIAHTEWTQKGTKNSNEKRMNQYPFYQMRWNWGLLQTCWLQNLIFFNPQPLLRLAFCLRFKC